MKMKINTETERNEVSNREINKQQIRQARRWRNTRVMNTNFTVGKATRKRQVKNASGKCNAEKEREKCLKYEIKYS